MVFHHSDSFHHSKFFLLCSIVLLTIWLLSACAPQQPILSPSHINTQDVPPSKEDIPPLIQQRAFVPPPQPTPPLETYTVVVDAVPIDKLLFALARDADLNIDIHPGISGTITLNAIDQTLPQLLERIAKQVDIRYQINGNHLTISPDLPYMHLYQVDYVNLSRESENEVKVATQVFTNFEISGSGGLSSDNNSKTKISSKSNNDFWQTLQENIIAILASYLSKDSKHVNKEHLKDKVIINSQSGVVTVYATARQHREIQRFLDQVLANVQRQVAIKVTIVEVQLSDEYQAGVDWQRIAGDFKYTQALIPASQDLNFYTFEYHNPNSKLGNVSAMVRLLEKFGTVKVLSSPIIMALNNQPAVFKVVDNIVYFTTDVEITETETRSRETYETVINTVPIGLIMTVIPQISDNDTVILNIRPTISRVLNFKQDPNPVLAQAGTVNEIPEIETREMASVLKINNNNVAIIGGLMQDSTQQKTQGVPVLSQLPLIGDLFSYRENDYTKNELVIFLQPRVIKDASLSGDLQEYRAYLPDPSQPDRDAPTGFTQP